MPCFLRFWSLPVIPRGVQVAKGCPSSPNPPWLDWAGHQLRPRMWHRGQHQSPGARCFCFLRHNLWVTLLHLSCCMLNVCLGWCLLWLCEPTVLLSQVFSLVLNQVFKCTSLFYVSIFCCFLILIGNRINFLACFLREANRIHHLHHKVIQCS